MRISFRQSYASLDLADVLVRFYDLSLCYLVVVVVEVVVEVVVAVVVVVVVMVVLVVVVMVVVMVEEWVGLTNDNANKSKHVAIT